MDFLSSQESSFLAVCNLIVLGNREKYKVILEKSQDSPL